MTETVHSAFRITAIPVADGKIDAGRSQRQHRLPRLNHADTDSARRVIAAARHTDWLERQAWQGVQCQAVDLLSPVNLSALLTGCDTVYYLVHSMGEGGDFIAHERQVAMNVRDALLQTPVKQVIFLSSLQAPEHEQSDHRSRHGCHFARLVVLRLVWHFRIRNPVPAHEQPV